MWKRGEDETGHLRSGPEARCCILSSGNWASPSFSSNLPRYTLGARAKLDPAVWAPVESSFEGKHNGVQSDDDDCFYYYKK